MPKKEYFKYRGLVEGFYGRPWTQQERLSAFRFLGKQGFNIYYYAPKDDPYHREFWKKPYPPKQAKLFGALATAAKNNGLIFSFAISPGNSIRYNSDSDLKLLLAKIENAASLGANAFALFLDDIPFQLVDKQDKARFKDLATAQAHLTNQLYRELKKRKLAAHFTMCPTAYCGDPNTNHLKRLGLALDKGIEVFWTGPNVCSSRLTTEHTRAISRSLRRKVLYWDNYPVNDSVMAFEPHLGPYSGREKSIHRYCSGIVSNPSLQPEATKIPLYTIGDYLRNPYDYDPIASWQTAIKLVAGAGAYKAFRDFADHCWKSCIYQEEARIFRHEIRKLGHLSGFGRKTTRQLLHYLANQNKEASYLACRAKNRQLIKELRPWLSKYRQLLNVFTDCIKLLDEQLGNNRQARIKPLEQRIEKDLFKAWKNYYSVSDTGIMEEIKKIRAYVELVKKR